MSKQITNNKVQRTEKNSYLLSNKQGFTLVELLVVVAIMAVLMALLFPNFMLARQRARDTQRKSELSEIKKALELYIMDQKPPIYPSTGALPVSLCGQCWSSGGSCTGNIYMRKIPCDPGSLNPTPYIYRRDASDNLRYNLSACLENLLDPDRDSTPEPTCAATATSYTVHEP